MSGIKLNFDETTGDADVADVVEYHECLIDDCLDAQLDYTCGHDGRSIWDIFRQDGFCPKLRWYRETKVKEYCKEESERENNRRGL